MEAVKTDYNIEKEKNVGEKIKNIISIIVFIISTIVILGVLAVNAIMFIDEFVKEILGVGAILFVFLLMWGEIIIAILFRMSLGIENKTLAKILSIINIIASVSIIVTWIVGGIFWDYTGWSYLYTLLSISTIGSVISLPMNIILLVRNQTMSEYTGFVEEKTEDGLRKFKVIKSKVNIILISSIFLIYIIANMFGPIISSSSYSTIILIISIVKIVLTVTYLGWFITSEIVFSVREKALTKEKAIK